MVSGSHLAVIAAEMLISDLRPLHSTEDLPNLLIIERANATTYRLITPKFSGRYDNRQPKVVDQFDAVSGFHQRSELFPDKFIDLQLREVRLAFCEYQPYSVWSEVVSLVFIQNQ